SINRAETIKQIREKLSLESRADDWVDWGRWFLADPATRTISPFSKITVPEYIENRIKENTTESLAEAERLAYGNGELLGRISLAQKLLGQGKRGSGAQTQAGGSAGGDRSPGPLKLTGIISISGHNVALLEASP